MLSLFRNKTSVTIYLLLLAGFVVIGLHACKKSDGLVADPYGKKVQPLVKFLDEDPQPASGTAGTRVTFYIQGLQGRDTSGFKLYINQERAQIVSVQDTAITAIVPATASSGAVSILIDGQNYFGPIFNVDGYVRIDPTFNAGIGVNVGGSVNGIFQNSDNSYFLVGTFTDYNGQATTANPINNIVKLGKDGAYVNSTKEGDAVVGGNINDILYANGQYFIAGSFTSYNNFPNVNNITRILSTAELDTTTIRLINLDTTMHQDDTASLPAFNGGVDGFINHIYYDGTGIVAIGSFYRYLDYYYLRSTKNGYVQDRYNVKQFVRMSADGVLDSSYNIDPVTGIGYQATNGFVNSSTQLSNGKIIIAGSFSSFNGAAAGHIAMLGDNGQMDPTFNAGQSGADDQITRITYNANLHKIMLTGTFKHYNGVSVPGIVMINEDGSIDNTFHFGTLTGGVADFAAQLSNGLVLVTGTFTGYNGIFRQGMLFLNPDGSMALGYNNMGSFVGRVNKIYESPTAFGTLGVIVIGSFSLVDNHTINGVVKLEVQ